MKHFDHIDTLIDQKCVQVLMRSGRWWDIRRNGVTQRWKRDPARIRIPFKMGLRGYGAITETDFIDGNLDPRYYRVKE